MHISTYFHATQVKTGKTRFQIYLGKKNTFEQYDICEQCNTLFITFEYSTGDQPVIYLPTISGTNLIE